MKVSTKLVIAIVVMLGISGIVIIICNKSRKSNESSDYRKPLFLLRTNDNKIHSFDYESKEIKTVFSANSHGIGAFASYYEETIYYATRKPNDRIYSSSTLHKNLTHHTEKWTKTEMAVDHSAGVVYVVDGVARKIHVADVHSDYHRDEVFDLSKNTYSELKDIAFHASFPEKFVLGSDTIYRIEDGKIEEVTSDDDFQAFTVDFSNKILYYSNGHKVIFIEYECCRKYNCHKYTYDLANVTSLAYLNNRLFFIENAIDTANQTLKTCVVDDIGCLQLEMLYSSPHLEEFKFHDVHATDQESNCTLMKEPCEHMCISLTGQCACTEGWYLDGKRKCYPEDKLYVVTENTAIAKYNFENATLDKPLVESKWGIRSFDLYHSDTIFYSTTKPNERILCNDEMYHNNMQDITLNWTMTAMAIDYSTGNVFIADEVHGQVNVARIYDEPANILLTGLDKPRNILLHPESGLMFIQQASSVLQANMDGTDVREIYKKFGLSAIALNRREQKLYIAIPNAIVCIDFRSNKRSKVADLKNQDVISLAVASGDLFAVIEKDSVQRSIQQCHLANGAESCQFTVLYEDDSISDIKSKAIDDYKIKTPCQNKNGDCHHLCLLRNEPPGFSCMCQYGWSSSDGKFCSRIYQRISK